MHKCICICARPCQLRVVICRFHYIQFSCKFSEGNDPHFIQTHVWFNLSQNEKFIDRMRMITSWKLTRVCIYRTKVSTHMETAHMKNVYGVSGDGRKLHSQSVGTAVCTCSDLSVVCVRAHWLNVFVSGPTPTESAENERMEKPKYVFSVVVGTDEKSLFETTQFPRKRSALVIRRSDYLLPKCA